MDGPASQLTVSTDVDHGGDLLVSPAQLGAVELEMAATRVGLALALQPAEQQRPYETPVVERGAGGGAAHRLGSSFTDAGVISMTVAPFGVECNHDIRVHSPKNVTDCFNDRLERRPGQCAGGRIAGHS